MMASIIATKKANASSLRSIVLPARLVPKVEIDKRSDHRQQSDQENKKPSLRLPDRLPFKGILRFEDIGCDCLPEPQIRAAAQVAFQHGVNIFRRHFGHGLPHQKGRDLLTIIVCKLKAVYRWLGAGRQAQRDNTERLFA